MFKRRFKIALLIGLALVVLVFVFLLAERWRGQIALAHCKRELVAKRENLSPRDFTHSLTTEDNALPEISDATKRLKGGASLLKRTLPGMKVTPAGRAIVGFRQDEWIDGGVTNRWEQVASDLHSNAATLSQIRAALEKPVLRENLDFSQGFKMAIPLLKSSMSLIRWLGAGSQISLREGKTQDAVEFLRAEIQVPRLLAEDRIMISELVRAAIASIARGATWEALQADGWSDKDLASVQRAWEDQNFAAGSTNSLAGELVYGSASFEMLRNSNADAFQALFRLDHYSPEEDSDRPFWERATRNLPWGEAIADFLKRQVYCRV